MKIIWKVKSKIANTYHSFSWYVESDSPHNVGFGIFEIPESMTDLDDDKLKAQVALNRLLWVIPNVKYNFGLVPEYNHISARKCQCWWSLHVLFLQFYRSELVACSYCLVRTQNWRLKIDWRIWRFHNYVICWEYVNCQMSNCHIKLSHSCKSQS